MKPASKINNLFDKIFLYLGKSNDSEVVTASLAAFKLIFIPIATSRDKNSTIEQKRYTIKRDLITESTALLGYIGITKVLKNTLSAPVCAKYYKNKAEELSKNKKLDINSSEYNILSNVDKNALKNCAMADLSSKKACKYTLEQKEYIEKLEAIIKKSGFDIQNPKNLYLNTKKIISHVSVCILALSVIPFSVNEILKVINKSEEKNKNNNDKTLIGLQKPFKMNEYINYIKQGGFNVFNY